MAPLCTDTTRKDNIIGLFLVREIHTLHTVECKRTLYAKSITRETLN